MKFILPFLFFTLSFYLNAQHRAYLDIGNVRALVSSDGLLFQDTATNHANFKVPKGDSVHTISLSTLWMTSIHQRNGFPHYSFGYDAYSYGRFDVQDLFKTGPVDVVHQKRDPSKKFQRLWKINKAEINRHIQNWSSQNYQADSSILNWPGNGNDNTAKILAPFEDLDGDSIYEPNSGEFPIIKGDQAIFLMINNFKNNSADTGYTYIRDPNQPWLVVDSFATETFGYTQTEIHYMIYAYNSSQTHIANTVFMNLKLFNRSNKGEDDLKSFKFSILTEFTHGNNGLHFIGTDTTKQLYFGYNSGLVSDSTGAPQIYRAQGMNLLSNSLTQTMQIPIDNGTVPVFELPIRVADFQKNIWHNGRRLRSGGNGFNTCIDTSTTPVFMFPGDLTAPRDSSHWSEFYPCYKDSSIKNAPGIKRIIGTPNVSSHFNHSTNLELDYAYVFAQDTGGVVASIAALQVAADSVQAFYDRKRSVGINETSINSELDFDMFPNPAKGVVAIETDVSNFEIEIINIQGSITKRYRNTRIIDISELLQGIYFVKIGTVNSVGVKRLIVTK